MSYEQRLKALRLPEELKGAVDERGMGFGGVVTQKLPNDWSKEKRHAWTRLIDYVMALNAITIPVDLVASTPVNLPDFEGGSWATEWAYLRSPEQVRKFRFWRRPDPNPMPHNHPWRNSHTGVSFVSQILFGGYTEDVYRIEGGVVKKETTTYTAEDVNVCFYDGFHVVRDVLPGTFTHFVTEAVVEGNVWHYLDLATGKLVEPVPMADFLEQRDRVNPK